MLRALIAVGLVFTTLAPVEARGFRITFRPRLAMPRTYVRQTPVDVAPQRRDDRLAIPAQSATNSASILDSGAIPPVADKVGSLATKKAAAPEHWCDNGTLVGTGTGFCVVKVSAGAPS